LSGDAERHDDVIDIDCDA